MKSVYRAVVVALLLCVMSSLPALAASDDSDVAAAPPAPEPPLLTASAGEAALAALRDGDPAVAETYLASNAAAQTALRARLAQAAAQVSLAASEIDDLQVQIEATDCRITIEQGQLRVLARAIYQQPESPLVALGTSGTLGEAMTRVSSLLASGRRAADTKRALEIDLAKAAAQRTRLRADLVRKEALQARLDGDYHSLQHYAGEVQRSQEQGRVLAAQIPRAGGATQLRMQEVIRQAWAPLGPAAVVWAERIAFCESTYNPYSVNSSSAAAGLFQFMPATWAGTPYAAQSPFDPVANATAAAWLYQRYGPRQWDCSYRV